MVTLNQTDQNKNITNHKKLDTTESNDITATKVFGINCCTYIDPLIVQELPT